MLTIAICDDEPQFCDLLSEKLSSIMSVLDESYSVSCYNHAVDFQKTNKDFDIVFLDIQMPDINGLEIAKFLRRNGYSGALIFITTFQEYVFEVFEFDAIDYLCKPVDDLKLQKSIKRARNKIKIKQEKSLFIQTAHWCKSIKIQTIIYCEVMNRKLYLHTLNGVIDYYGKIEELELQLDDRFYRCHRSYLVNLDYLSTYSDGQVLLENRDCVPVSRLRQKEFMEVMLQYLKRKKSK